MDFRKIKMLNIFTLVQRFPLIKNYINIFKYNFIYKISLGDSSMATIEIDDNLKKKLEARAKKTGLSQYDMANSYIFNGLKEDERYECNGGMTPEEIFELLDHDLPEGDWVSEELAGLVETKYITNALKLNKDSYK